MKQYARNRCSVMDKAMIAGRIKTFFQNRKIRSIPFIIIAGIVIFFLAYRINYRLHPDIKFSYQLVPDNVSFCIEIRNPASVYNRIIESDFGRSVETSEAWKQLALTPEFKKLINILYFLQVKAGINIEYGEIPSFLGNSMGYAESNEGRHLLVFQTNAKSLFAVSLLKYFKGEQVYVEDTPRPAARQELKTGADGQKPVTPDQYESPYPEEKVQLSNLSVTHLKMGDSELYMAMMGDFLFLSDSIDFLEKSLYLGVKPTGSSLVKENGMYDVMKSMKSRGDIFIYQSAKRGFLAPVLTSLVKGSGLAMILHCGKSEPLSGDIYTIGAPDNISQVSIPDTGWESRIPSDNIMCLVTNTVGINQACQSLQTLDKEWDFLKSGLNEYFAAMKIKPDQYFNDKNGFALCIRKLNLENNMVYPLFIVGYESKITDDSFFRGIFKTKGPLSRAAQSGRNYMYRPDGPDQYYTPSLYTDKQTCFISSDKDTMDSVISASLHYRPVVSDLASFNALGIYTRAPHHLIIQVEPLLQGLKNFLYYTAEKNPDYTSKTIDRDIVPLAEPFKAYSEIHMAFGMDKNPSGKVIVMAR